MEVQEMQTLLLSAFGSTTAFKRICAESMMVLTPKSIQFPEHAGANRKSIHAREHRFPREIVLKVLQS